MTHRWFCFVALLSALVFVGPLGPTSAHAQAVRTWVSGVGDDANPCSRTAPCKTFAGAISKTATFGEINVLDPGGFGAVTITKSITIRSDHIEAGLSVPGTNGIIVNLPSATDRAILDGLDIDGAGTGLNGVRSVGSGKTTVSRCTIRGFTQAGIDLEGAANARVFIQDTQIIGNNNGFFIQGASGATNNALLDHVTIDSNSGGALIANGPGTTFVSNSLLTGNATAITATGGASVTSYGNNVIRGTGGPTATLPLQ